MTRGESKMKTKDVPVLKQKVLDMLPITQANMWKKLGIDSSEGSSLANIMLKENLITRKRQDGSFLLERANGNGKMLDIEIMADDDLKQKAEDDIKQKAEDDLKQKAEDDIKQKAEDDIKQKAEDDLKQKAEDDLKQKAEDDLKQKAEDDLKQKVEDDIKQKAEDDLEQKADIVRVSPTKNIMKINKISVDYLKKKVLEILPITQVNMWKTLGISDRDGSNLVNIMLEEKLITRKKQNRSFLLEGVDIKRKKDKNKVDYMATLSRKNRFAPCCGCALECDATMCILFVHECNIRTCKDKL